MNILIIDDDQRVRREFRDKLSALLPEKDGYGFIELKKEAFEEEVHTLEKRRKRLWDTGTFELSDSAFDGADIVIVENDLAEFQFGFTAEFVAYHARCFSRCGFILGVDQYGKNSFDLTLRDHPRSFADLNIGSKQIGNPGLWQQDGWDQTFRPWCWPLVPDAVRRLQERAGTLKGHLDEPLFNLLGFPQEVSDMLAREIIEFVSRRQDLGEFQKTTVREFLFYSGNGFDRKDAIDAESPRIGIPEEIQCRVASARLGKWLETLVLPCQDILSDAPHLIRRYPSLLRSGERTPEAANFTARLCAPAELGIAFEKIEAHRFPIEAWLSRPAWFADALRRFDQLPEVKDPWSNPPLELVFCEDISRFTPEAEARAFEAELPTPDTRRWVKEPPAEGVAYEPEVRFAL